MSRETKPIKDAKKLFRKKGACSHTLFYILNREFGNNNDAFEFATDPLAGGIMQQGHQCGMLWGSTLGAGVEAFKRIDDQGKAISVAMSTTEQIISSFQKRTNAIDCLDVTECDFNSKFAMAKFMLTGKFLSCFTLIEKWAPEAIGVAYQGLTANPEAEIAPAVSCASEVIRKMGGSDQQVVMVAGFAGGIGLSGHACGALAAAIWFKSIEWVTENQGKGSMTNPIAKRVIDNFYEATDYKMLCSDICDRKFKSIEEHTEYIQDGGCASLIDALAET